MPKDMDSTFTSTIQEMVDCCEKIDFLLLSDQEFFAKNQLDLINDSNQKKTQLLNRLNVLTMTLSSGRQTIPPNLLQKVEKCYQSLKVSNGIVYANLQLQKDFLDKWIACKAKESIYDHKGAIK